MATERKYTMKKLLILAAAASTMAIAAPAAAQTVANGTVDLTGTVQAKCTAADFTDAINLGELALTDGTVDSAFSGNSNLTRAFSIKCTAGNVRIGVVADPLEEATDETTGDGYTGTVHYTATVVADKAGSGTATADYATLTDTLEETADLGDRLKNAADNIRVTVSNGVTSNTGDLLKAGSYSGQIRISVSPI